MSRSSILEADSYFRRQFIFEEAKKIYPWISNIKKRELKIIKDLNLRIVGQYTISQIWASKALNADISKSGFNNYYNWVYEFWHYSHIEVYSDLKNNIIYKIMKIWKKEPPPKYVLEDFKKCLLGYPNFYNLNHKDKYKINMIDNIMYYIVKYNEVKLFEMIELIVYFTKNFEMNYDLEDIKNSEIKLKIEKLIAGKKIANFVEKYMDDEFELRSMRMRIDLRKIIEGKL